MRLNCSFCLVTGLLIVLQALVFSSLKAQQLTISTGQGKVYRSYDNRIDALVVLRGVDASTELKVIPDDGTTSVEWYEYYNHTSSPVFHTEPMFMSNQVSFTPENACGYIVRLTGVTNGQPTIKNISVFVVDYLLFLPSDAELVPVFDQGSVCEQFDVEIKGNYPEMFYATPNRLVYPVIRELTLGYESYEWNDKWSPKQVNITPNVVNRRINIAEPPLKDTYFTLKGDQFASDLGLGQFEIKSQLYQARKVICKITTQTSIRTEIHESDRPELATAITGSAPLEIRFKANGNEPVSNYYNWTLQEAGEVILSRTDEEHSYTFAKAGTFLVKVRAENAFCTYTDSITIKISESAISAPNAFTPNGDEINDEFRVAYKSIVEFQGVIFNRWGSKLFEWTDIQKGWDGTYKGRPVHEGPYFYVIRARGSDGIIYNLKGDINLLRGNVK